MRSPLLTAPGPQKGFWTEAPCLGCKQPLNTTYPEARICSDCRSWLYEWLAGMMCPEWDKVVMHDGEELCSVLEKLYCWNADGKRLLGGRDE